MPDEQKNVTSEEEQTTAEAESEDVEEETFDDEDVPAAEEEYEDDFDEDYDEDEDDYPDVTYSDGPAVFFRTKEGRRRGRRTRRVGQEVDLEEIDYKRVQVLSRFVDKRGRILSRRKTRASAKMQRRVTKAIKRARHLALMPYTGEHVRITRKR